MTQRFSYPGLGGAFPSAFFGRATGAPPPSVPDFALSNAGVSTAWGLVTVGDLIPINAPPGVTFRLVETSGALGDEAGLAVVNG